MIRNAREHNLKGVDVTIPRDRFTVVTGVSGSGKSTLARDVLLANVQAALGGKRKWGGCEGLEGFEQVDRVLEVDQTPIGKTPRSCPATYVGFWDAIRKLFADTAEELGEIPMETVGRIAAERTIRRLGRIREIVLVVEGRSTTGETQFTDAFSVQPHFRDGQAGIGYAAGWAPAAWREPDAAAAAQHPLGYLYPVTFRTRPGCPGGGGNPLRLPGTKDGAPGLFQRRRLSRFRLQNLQFQRVRTAAGAAVILEHFKLVDADLARLEGAHTLEHADQVDRLAARGVPRGHRPPDAECGGVRRTPALYRLRPGPTVGGPEPRQCTDAHAVRMRRERPVGRCQRDGRRYRRCCPRVPSGHCRNDC